jgi:hypothetical protein
MAILLHHELYFCGLYIMCGLLFLASPGCDRILGQEHKRWEAGELEHIKKIGREIKEGKGENRKGIM